MIAAMDESHAESGWTRASHRIITIATVLGWIAVAWVIASSYVGHSFSPYGTCQNASGRGIQCIAGRR